MGNEKEDNEIKCKSVEGCSFDDVLSELDLSDTSKTDMRRKFGGEDFRYKILSIRQDLFKMDGINLDWSESDFDIKRRLRDLNNLSSHYRFCDNDDVPSIRLMKALDAAGFIRHDITSRELCMHLLYFIAWDDATRWKDSNYPYQSFVEHCEDWTLSPVYSNVVYEQCNNLSRSQMDEFMDAVSSVVVNDPSSDENSFKLVNSVFGLSDGSPNCFSDVYESKCIIRYEAIIKLSKALDSLHRQIDKLPVLLNLS